jgi:hypothetical protein
VAAERHARPAQPPRPEIVSRTFLLVASVLHFIFMKKILIDKALYPS